MAMLRVLPPTKRKAFQPFCWKTSSKGGGKMRNIAIQPTRFLAMFELNKFEGLLLPVLLLLN